MTLEEQLAQLQQENDTYLASPEAKMASQGIVFSDPEVHGKLQSLDKLNNTLIKNKVPSSGNAVRDYIASFNYEIPKAVSFLMGVIGPSQLKPEVRAQNEKVILDAMHSIGINAASVDSLAGEIGAQNFSDLLTSAVALIAAPYMAAAKGTTAVSGAVKTIGESIQKYPGREVIANLAAGGGATAAQELSGQTEGVGGATTALGGAIAGGGIAGTAMGAGKATLRTVGKVIPDVIAEKIPGMKAPQLPIAKNVLRDYSADPQDAQIYAQEAVDGAKIRLDRTLQDAVSSVPDTGSPAQNQAAFRKSLERAERIGNRIVGEFWDQVPLQNPVPMSGIRQALNDMRAELAGTPSQEPTEFMNRLYRLGQPTQDPATGKFVSMPPSIQRLRDLRSEIRTARVEEQASAAPRAGLIRNYNRLEGIIDDGIQSAYPNDVSIDQARKVSILYHDTFTRSNLGPVMAKDVRGANVVPPGQSVEELMGQYGGTQDIITARNKLLYKRAPGGGSFAVTPQERTQVQQMAIDAENSIRAMFHDIASTQGEQAAAKWVGRNKEAIAPLARVEAEMDFAAGKINAALQEQVQLQRSAIAKYASTDPKFSFKRLINSGTAIEDANQVMLTLRRDPNAVNGFRASAIDEMLNRTNGDPIRVQEFLADTKIEKLYRAVLGDAAYNRLQRNANIAYHLAVGDETLLHKNVIARATFLGRLLGAQAGRITSRVLGGGTIQVPGMFADRFSKAVERWLRATDPRELFVNSIVDPKWEQLLLARTPNTIREGKRMLRTIRRVAQGIATTRAVADAQLGAEEND